MKIFWFAYTKRFHHIKEDVIELQNVLLQWKLEHFCLRWSMCIAWNNLFKIMELYALKFLHFYKLKKSLKNEKARNDLRKIKHSS